MSARDAIIEKFLEVEGWGTATRVQVAGDASNRRYDRLTQADGRTAILMDAPPETGENVRPFVFLSNWLRARGLSTPEIYAENTAEGLLIIEDFGDDLFARLMVNDPDQIDPLYRAAVEVLLTLRSIEKPALTPCDAAWLTEMLEPAFEWYAPYLTAAQRTEIENIFEPFAQEVAQQDRVIMLRDYHVENLLLLPDRAGVARVGLLDFQDAMLAHPAYDLVSILQDARRDVDQTIEEKFVTYYLDHAGMDPERFRRDYAVLGLQRNLRIVGIFARLSQRDGKPHYVDMIPRVWGYVMRNLAHPDLAELRACITAAFPNPTPDLLRGLKTP